MQIVRDYWRFAVKPEIYFGNNAIKGIGKHISRLGCKKVLIVTDKGLAAAGILRKVTEPLKEENIGHEVFDGGEPEPRVVVAEEAINFVKGKDVDAVIGLGGGAIWI